MLLQLETGPRRVEVKSEERITAPMPAMPMSELVGLHDEQLPVQPDPDTFDAPTTPRYRVRAFGTDQAIRKLDGEPADAMALATALEALMTEGAARVPPSRAPTERLPATYVSPGQLAYVSELGEEPPTLVCEPAPRHRGLAIAASGVAVLILSVLFALLFSLL